MKYKWQKTLKPNYWRDSKYELMERKEDMLLFKRTLKNDDVYFDLVSINDLDGYLTCNACWHFTDIKEALVQLEWSQQNKLN